MKSTARVITGEKPLAPRHLLPDIASVCLCHMGTERCPRWSQTPGRQPVPAKQMWADVQSLTSSQHRKLNCRADKMLPATDRGMISQAALREGQMKQKVARRTWQQSRAVRVLGMRVRAGAPLSERVPRHRDETPESEPSGSASAGEQTSSRQASRSGYPVYRWPRNHAIPLRDFCISRNCARMC